jgi:protein-tyrosine-phosphatase
MAEANFNALVEERGLAYRAASAGVAALEGGDITPSARGARGGRNLQRGASREAGERVDAKEADLVLAISPRQWCSFAGASGSLSERVYTLPEYALGDARRRGDPDPYGLTITTAFRASVRLRTCHRFA